MFLVNNFYLMRNTLPLTINNSGNLLLVVVFNFNLSFFYIIFPRPRFSHYILYNDTIIILYYGPDSLIYKFFSWFGQLWVPILGNSKVALSWGRNEAIRNPMRFCIWYILWVKRTLSEKLNKIAHMEAFINASRWYYCYKTTLVNKKKRDTSRYWIFEFKFYILEAL